MGKFNSVVTAFFLGWIPINDGFALELPAPSQVEDFSGALRSSHYKVTVGTPELVLAEQTFIKADEVVIDGTIITQGFQLTIDARRLEFKEGAKIQAFASSAPVNSLRPAEAAQGANGCNACVRADSGRERDGGKGGSGAAGVTGFQGSIGKASPGPILVFASEVIGVPHIDGTGEKGGKGGTGGQGGRGGSGGHGEKAWVGVFFSWDAGHGGDSGQRGAGGQGGDGGHGGDAVPVIFLTSKHAVGHLALNAIQSAPGTGGEGGAGGLVGGVGTVGQGGDGGSCWRLFGTKVCGAGPAGQVDHSFPVPAHRGTGDSGKPGEATAADNKHYKPFIDDRIVPVRNAILADFNELETLRTEVARSWYQFHWSRILRLLVSESIAHLLARKDGEELFADGLDFLGDDLKGVLLARGESLTTAWQDQLVRPLEAEEELAGAVISKNQLLEIAQPLLAGLRETNRINPQIDVLKDRFEASLLAVDAFFRASLNHALQKCSNYNGELKGRQSLIFGRTNHFEIPVCLGKPDMADPKHSKDTYQVFASYALKVPDGVVYEEVKPVLVVPAPAQVARTFFPIVSLPSLFGWFEGLFSMNTAYAGFDVLFLEGKTIELDQIRKLMPTTSLGTPTERLTGFQMISKEDAIQKLSFHLGVISGLTRK